MLLTTLTREKTTIKEELLIAGKLLTRRGGGETHERF